MSPEDVRIIARVLAKYRDSEAGATIGGVVAMITCDLSDECRKADPDFDYLGYWNAVEDERHAERARVAQWIAEARERMTR